MIQRDTEKVQQRSQRSKKVYTQSYARTHTYRTQRRACVQITITGVKAGPVCVTC